MQRLRGCLKVLTHMIIIHHKLAKTETLIYSNKINCWKIICWFYILPRDKIHFLSMRGKIARHVLWHLKSLHVLEIKKLDKPATRRHVSICTGSDGWLPLGRWFLRQGSRPPPWRNGCCPWSWIPPGTLLAGTEGRDWEPAPCEATPRVRSTGTSVWQVSVTHGIAAAF